MPDPYARPAFRFPQTIPYMRQKSGDPGNAPSGQIAFLPIVDRLQRRSAWRAKGPNIPHRWLAEETAVFAAELAGAFVSHLKGRTGGVHTIHEHASPRCLQPKLFLILKRTHGGQHPEMMVQRGDAHARDFREVFHPQRLRIVRTDPGDRSCRSMALLS